MAQNNIHRQSSRREPTLDSTGEQRMANYRKHENSLKLFNYVYIKFLDKHN